MQTNKESIYEAVYLVKSIAADMTIRIVPADKADMLMVTDNGLEAAEHMEEEPTVVDEGTYSGKLQERIKHTKILTQQ